MAAMTYILQSLLSGAYQKNIAFEIRFYYSIVSMFCGFKYYLFAKNKAVIYILRYIIWILAFLRMHNAVETRIEL